MDSNSTQEDDIKILPENNSRRIGMRFSTIDDFLASLNTATTTVRALHGLQKISLESYQKCMQGAESGDDAAFQMLENGKSKTKAKGKGKKTDDRDA